jgi:UDPglucose 6-dehydrogenase
MRICVVGSGYVGLVTGACLADFGMTVTNVDKDAAKIEALRRGEIPIYEPGLETLVATNVAAGRLAFATELGPAVEAARAVFIAVGTPPRSDGSPDLSFVREVAEQIGAHLNDYKVIVTKSTVPIGTGRMIEEIVKATSHGRQEFAVVSNPEFLREGSAIEDFLHPDRLVIGSRDPRAVEIMLDIYSPLRVADVPFVITDTESSEMIKYASNSFLATKISFINEIANVSEELGADVSEVARGMGLDARIGDKFLKAGLGFGGSCFPKDVSALKQLAGNSGYAFQLLNSVIEVNELQKRRAVGKLQKHLGSLVGKEIALRGLAFKPNTVDMRVDSSLVLSARLQAAGARVRVYDPVAEEEARKLIRGVDFKGSAMEAGTGADAVVLVTEWPEFADLDLGELASSMRGRLVVDGRNFLDAAKVRGAGLDYEGIGRPALKDREPARTA